MKKIQSFSLLYKLFCLLLLLISSAFVEQLCGEHLFNIFRYIIILILIVGFNKKLLIGCDKVQIFYILVLFLGLVAHYVVPVETNPLREFLAWVQIVFVFSLLKFNYNRNSHLFVIAILSFYLIECLLSVYERVTLSYFINYDISDYYSFESLQFVSDSNDFRSNSLLFHPLNNANVVSIFMAFFLTSKVLGKYFKYSLLCLGIAAMWGFNSRGAMMVWLFILFYRFFLYDNSLKKIVFLLICLALILPSMYTALMEKELLGRLDFDFSDNSSQTRLLAFLLFAAQPWTLKSILFGGEVIMMPGTDLSIENGVLLTLSYWGWVIGFLKILLELVISYRCLRGYLIKDRFIILMAFWGVSFTNNNSFKPTMFAFYAIIFVFFQFLEYNIKIKKHSKKHDEEKVLISNE